MTESKAKTPAEAELNAIENIVIAETKDHADWELLGHIAHRSEDSQLSQLLKPAVAKSRVRKTSICIDAEEDG